MNITADAVKQLRERTGAGMMECKKALVETNGDLDAAAENMRKSGLAKADKKASRVAAEGVVVVEKSADGKTGVLVEVNSETDFVARGDDFRGFAGEVAKVKEEFKGAVPAGKPPEIVEKIVEGKLNKWYEEHVLLDQPFVKDDTLSVNDLINAAVGSLGENIKVRRFAKFALGEN